MKVFYDHIIIIDDIITEIEVMDFEESEKQEIYSLVDSIIHHRVLEHILDMLDIVHHDEFLTRFYAQPDDMRHLVFLEKKTNKDMVSELHKLSEALKKELRRDIKKHKKTKTARASGHRPQR